MRNSNQFFELKENLSKKFSENKQSIFSFGGNLETMFERTVYMLSEIEKINSQFKKKNVNYNEIIESLVALDIDIQFSIWWLSKSRRSLTNFIKKLEKDRGSINKKKKINIKKFSYLELRMKANIKRIALPTLEKLKSLNK